MEKSRIKEILRENLFTKLKETAPKETAPKAKPKSDSDNNWDTAKGEVTKKSSNPDKDYSEVQRKLQDTMLKQSQVMAAAGLGSADDATARSLFSKKVRKDTNEEGGQYLFDEKELAAIVKVINNPSSYLNVKNK